MKKTVTSILRCYGKILILKRSDKVRYHQGLWEGVAGHVEKDDAVDERAIMEIEEETGLKREQLRMIKRGEPFAVRDKNIGTEFLVHPYLFDVETNKVTIDWEHTEYVWIVPQDIYDYQFVPDLDRTLRAVGIEVRP